VPHPTTANYLIIARERDLEAAAAAARLVAEAREPESRRHDGDGLPAARWGIRLPRMVHTLRRDPAAGATTP
jgi:hypothetical protein